MRVNKVYMKAYGSLYEKGCRDINQDSALLYKAQTCVGEIFMAVVSDGLGGMDRGEIASGFLVEELASWFYKELPLIARRINYIKAIKISVSKLLYKSHNRLKEYGNENKIHTGTAAVICLGIRGHLMSFSIGDCGIYTVGRRAIRINAINNHKRNELSECIGIGRFITPKIYLRRLKRKQGLLLCSDGFYDKMEMRELLAVLNPKNNMSNAIINKGLKSMGRKYISKGAKDNMTALYLIF